MSITRFRLGVPDIAYIGAERYCEGCHDSIIIDGVGRGYSAHRRHLLGLQHSWPSEAGEFQSAGWHLRERMLDRRW